MAKQPDFDITAAHRYFAAECFNRTWDLIDKVHRTAEEDRLMVALNQASIFHWLNRPDHTDRNLSVGYWQASRVQALLGNAAEAARHAEVCLSYSGEQEPFYLGYAHEALARAAIVSADSVKARAYLAAADGFAERVAKADDKALLTADLAQLHRDLDALNGPSAT